MKDYEIEEKVEKGYIRVNIIFELVGKPKEHIETTLKKYLEEVESKEEDAIVVSKDFSDAKELDNGLFSVFCESDILVKNLETLTNFCYTYMPASIEITEPENMKYTNQNFSDMFNDLLFRLHEVSMELKKTIGKEKFAHDNSVKLIYNLVLLSLKQGEKDIEQIFEDTRINKDELEKFLESLISMKRIGKKDNGKYYANVVTKNDN